MGEQSAESVKSMYAAFGRGDVPAVLAGMADDIEWHESLGMPYGGVYRGGDAAVQNVFAPIATDVEGFAVVLEEVLGSGDASPRSSVTPVPAR